MKKEIYSFTNTSGSIGSEFLKKKINRRNFVDHIMNYTILLSFAPLFFISKKKIDLSDDNKTVIVKSGNFYWILNKKNDL
jgi:hypothetical protein